MSFVLSGTDWKDSYNDLSNPESKELRDKVLDAVGIVFGSFIDEFLRNLRWTLANTSVSIVNSGFNSLAHNSIFSSIRYS